MTTDFSYLTSPQNDGAPCPNFFESNMQLLQKYHPRTFKSLTSCAEPPVGEICKAPNGKNNLKIMTPEGNWVHLHDIQDPEKEVVQFKQIVPPEARGTVILMGIGLGYSIAALLKTRPEIQHFIAFELDPGIFKKALEVMDFSAILVDQRLILSVTPQPDIRAVLAPADRALQLEAIHTLRHLTSFSLNKDAYQKLNEAIYSHANCHNMEGGTMLSYGEKFVTNRLQFLNSIHHHQLLESLEGAFRDIPAILVAGGPSLDKNIHLLYQLKDRAVIICVDSALPALLSQGITPHFVTSIDYKGHTYEKIAGSAPEAKGINLICMSWVADKVPKIFPAENVFWNFALKPIEQWLNTMLGGRQYSRGATTVAHLNFIAAITMQCSPIIFIGQDLAYTDSKGYARNMVLTDHNQLGNQLRNNKDLQWVKGVYEDKVPTSRQMLSMKQSFESMIAQTPGHYINATEGGAHIEGTEILPLQAVMDDYCLIEHDFAKRLNHYVSKSPLPKSDKFKLELQTTLKNIKALKKTIEKADQLSQSIKKKLNRIKQQGVKYRNFNELPNKLQNQLNQIDTYHHKIDKDRIWAIVEELTMEGLRQSERMKHTIDQLADDTNKYIEWLLQNFARLDHISKVRQKVLTTLVKYLAKALDVHQAEATIMKKLEASNAPDGLLLNLAHLYFEIGDIMLLKKTLDRLAPDAPHTAKVYFYQGVIAAQHTEYEKANQYFEQCKQLDSTFINQIEQFQQKLGTEYIEYANFFRGRNRFNDCKKMLFKGLRYCALHGEIKKRVLKYADSDMDTLEKALETNNLIEQKNLIMLWHKEIESNPNLIECLSSKQVGELYRFGGHLFVLQENYAKALECFKKALFFAKSNPQYYLYTADVLFTQGNYDEGIAYLSQAVELDSNYARFWSNMGDNLQQARQYNNAIIAYEQCLKVFPLDISLVKKIGNCYQALSRESIPSTEAACT